MRHQFLVKFKENKQIELMVDMKNNHAAETLGVGLATFMTKVLVSISIFVLL